MFGNILGNFEKMKEEMEARLEAIQVKEESENGAVRVVVSGKGRIVDITLSDEVKTWELDHIEDVVLATLNRAIDAAEVEKTNEAQQSMSSILPPGLSNMPGGLFGK